MNQQTDVAQSSVSKDSQRGPLKWVGMEAMKAPLLGLHPHPIEASVSAFVSLSNPSQRGIHMSRIYELVQNLSEESITRQHIFNCLNKMMNSQNGSSDAAKLIIKAKPLFERKALKSDKKGFKSYPIKVSAKKVLDKTTIKLSVHVDYSSTCPCSAALSREAIAKGFLDHFATQNLTLPSAEEFLLNESTWPAWPHAQRSRAYGTFFLNENQEIPKFSQLIDEMENALSTPTQTAVKRVDEQEFARLNAQNLMFCEDAARKLKDAFQDAPFENFIFKVRHFESLHSHDVFAEVHK